MNFDNQPPYNYTSTPEHAYWLALETIKSPEGYYSFYYRLDQINSVEQCLANLDIEQHSLNDPWYKEIKDDKFINAQTHNIIKGDLSEEYCNCNNKNDYQCLNIELDDYNTLEICINFLENSQVYNLLETGYYEID